MNKPDKRDFEYKKQKLREYMTANGYDAVILARRDNFAWFTFGGDNKIFYSMDTGYGVLLITRQSVSLIAQTMDVDRIYDDEMYGLDVEKVALKWNEDSREEKAISMVWGQRIAADVEMEGADFKRDEIFALHLPYTAWEVERYEEVGKLTDEILKNVVDGIKQGQTEQQIAGAMLFEYAKHYSVPKVLLVGSDERIVKYRHPVPSDKKVEKTVLIHAATDIYGMHTNVTRMLCFGEPPKKLKKDYDLLNTLLASACSLLKPGENLATIIEERQNILEEAGCGHEFFNHYPGAQTGYWFGSADAIVNNEIIKETQCFDWFITVTGAKVEELVMAAPQGGTVLSATGIWPVKEYIQNKYSVKLPVILEK